MGWTRDEGELLSLISSSSCAILSGFVRVRERERGGGWRGLKTEADRETHRQR